MRLPIVTEEDYFIWECQDCNAVFCILHPIIRFEHDELLPVHFMHWGNEKDSPGCPHCQKRNTVRINDIDFFKPKEDD